MSVPICSFAWYELMTTDTAAAGAFYASVVGWGTTAVGSAEMPYTTFNVGKTGVAGLMTLPEDAGPAPAWIGYIHVPDVDGYMEKLKAAGGVPHKGPVDVPGMLRFAVVADAEGAPLVLFTSDPAMPANPEKPAVGTPGTIGWHELMATDLEASFEFYSGLFGWTKAEAHEMGPMGVYQTVAAEGAPSIGMMTRPAGLPGPFWTFYIHVESVKAAIERLTAGGGKLVNGPMQVPGGSWVAQAVDPQGAFFALMSMVE